MCDGLLKNIVLLFVFYVTDSSSSNSCPT